MSWEDDLNLLGPQVVAEIRRRIASTPPPTPELAEELRPIFAPAMQRTRQRRAAEHQAAAA